MHLRFYLTKYFTQKIFLQREQKVLVGVMKIANEIMCMNIYVFFLIPSQLTKEVLVLKHKFCKLIYNNVMLKSIKLNFIIKEILHI